MRTLKGSLPWHNSPDDAQHKHYRRHASSSSFFGRRTAKCEKCGKMFRKEDVKQKWCKWCLYDLSRGEEE